MSSWRASLDRASRRLLLREPFYGHLVVGVNKASAELDCLVRLRPSSRQVSFEVNPQRWEAASDDQRVAALRHELVHLVLKHPIRARDRERLDVWGMACDLVVNQLVDTEHLQHPLTVESFPTFPRGASADEYYALLLPLYERHCQGGQSDGSDAMKRWCENAGGSNGAHGLWKDFTALSSGVLSVLETNIDELLLATARRCRRRGWGPLPSELVAVLDALGQPPELPWRRLLRLFIAQSGRTQIKNTLSRPSKRYGTVPGTKVRRRHRLTVAVDTSGSVTDEELQTFFGEIYAVWRRGATVQVVEADAAVARHYEYRGVTPHAVGGRGGTSFDPAIRWSNANVADGLVYFTDGFAPAPTIESRCPILWVVTRGGTTDGLPGRTVRLTQ
ncbi:MAG: hypothetical protein JJ863_37470 [Deltaproteobacteria bacterium]|nr:hypothetical protein [Deltaproteobacteria bacterium]